MQDFTMPLNVISILADGQFHSVENIGKHLGISDAGTNQHIQTIRDWGIEILSISGKGYSLLSPMQLLDEAAIRQALPEQDGQVFLLPVIDSTNQYLLDRLNGLHSGDACIAEYQYAGRGRRGRRWFSPFGASIYLSMFWRLEQGPAAAVGLSLVVGIVIAEAMQRLGVVDIRVKWPNDLYLDDRKLAGILIESTGRTADVAQLVVGIGINLSRFTLEPGIINQPWITLQEAGINIDRNQLVIELLIVLRNALNRFEKEGLVPYLQRWRSLDYFINKPVRLLIGEKSIHGISRGVDTNGALLLESEGKIKAFLGGEMSLRRA